MLMTVNVTVLNYSVLSPLTASGYFPAELYVIIIAIAFAFFFLSILFLKSNDITGILASVMFLVAAWITPAIEFNTILSQYIDGVYYLVQVSSHPYTPYLVYIWLMMFFVCLFNLYRIWHIKMVEAVERRESES
jgi:glucan phosphoethanolaminetransferase (alkaline phosphatase superfamily)